MRHALPPVDLFEKNVSRGKRKVATVCGLSVAQTAARCGWQCSTEADTKSYAALHWERIELQRPAWMETSSLPLPFAIIGETVSETRM